MCCCHIHNCSSDPGIGIYRCRGRVLGGDANQLVTLTAAAAAADQALLLVMASSLADNVPKAAHQ